MNNVLFMSLFLVRIPGRRPFFRGFSALECLISRKMNVYLPRFETLKDVRGRCLIPGKKQDKFPRQFILSKGSENSLSGVRGPPRQLNHLASANTHSEIGAIRVAGSIAEEDEIEILPSPAAPLLNIRNFFRNISPKKRRVPSVPD